MVERIVQLANEMKEEGKSLSMINGALMSASATYGSYQACLRSCERFWDITVHHFPWRSAVATGNDGYLQPSGVDKLVEVYLIHANRAQEMKRYSIESEGKDTDRK